MSEANAADTFSEIFKLDSDQKHIEEILDLLGDELDAESKIRGTYDLDGEMYDAVLYRSEETEVVVAYGEGSFVYTGEGSEGFQSF